MPERGRIVPEIQLEDVREIIFKSYRIIYHVHGQHIEILRFGMPHGVLQRSLLMSLGTNSVLNCV